MALLQSPHWPFLIDVYFFLGGLAGGAFVIATVANLLDSRRYRDVVRAGYYVAFAALLPCPVILIVDLGVPARFLNMLLSFNPLSPMSMGAWALLAFSVCATSTALFTLLEDLGRARDLSGPKIVAGGIGGFFGFFLAAYPGVLLAARRRVRCGSTATRSARCSSPSAPPPARRRWRSSCSRPAGDRPTASAACAS